MGLSWYQVCQGNNWRRWLVFGSMCFPPRSPRNLLQGDTLAKQRGRFISTAARMKFYSVTEVPTRSLRWLFQVQRVFLVGSGSPSCGADSSLVGSITKSEMIPQTISLHVCVCVGGQIVYLRPGIEPGRPTAPCSSWVCLPRYTGSRNWAHLGHHMSPSLCIAQYLLST